MPRTTVTRARTHDTYGLAEGCGNRTHREPEGPADGFEDRETHQDPFPSVSLLHRLEVGLRLRRSPATTNGLESIFAVVKQWTGTIDRWHHSNQKQR